MNDQARDALGKVIRIYGPAICKTPRSCEMFIRQACGPYPDESKALIEALRQGVTDDLFGYQPAQHSWDQFAGQLRSRLKSKGGLGEADGAWAIDTWARVLDRHPETWVSAPAVVPVAIHDGPVPASPRALKTAMTIIVGLGGAIGGAVGAALVPGTLLITSAYAKLPIMNASMHPGSPKNAWVLVAMALLLLGAIGGVGGAIGGALGWLYGKGDNGHWKAFCTACGGGFASAALGSYFCGIFGSFFGAFLGSFGAATTTARRGGLA